MNRTRKLDVRCTPEELERWKLSADLEGVTFSRYVRSRIEGADCMPSHDATTVVSFADRVILACKALRGSI